MTDNPIANMFRNRNADPDEAKFYWTGGPVEVAPGVWFQSMFSGMVAFDTDDGLVLVDSGTKQMSQGLARQLRQKTDKPVHTAIYTHGHVDHAYGLPAFLLPEQPAPQVIAHAAILARFERYTRTPGHNKSINARQFGGSPDAVATTDLFGEPPILPTRVFDSDISIEVGGLAFELHHCRGETDDHTWVFCPEKRVLCPGDLFIYAVPNAGNPQKAQRYPWDWADGLRAMAACKPTSLCPGHGGPVIDNPDKIERMLLETAGYLESLVSQTLAALEHGSPPHVDIVHQVRPPDSDSPWLQPVYDEAEFIVRNIIRYFGGWWSGRPSELKPAPRDALASELAALCGGAGKLIERAQKLADDGDWRLACHLLDYALEAAPEDTVVREAAARLYEQRAATETSLMAINLFNSAAAYARQGRSYA